MDAAFAERALADCGGVHPWPNPSGKPVGVAECAEPRNETAALQRPDDKLLRAVGCPLHPLPRDASPISARPGGSSSVLIHACGARDRQRVDAEPGDGGDIFSFPV